MNSSTSDNSDKARFRNKWKIEKFIIYSAPKFAPEICLESSSINSPLTDSVNEIILILVIDKQFATTKEYCEDDI